MRNILLFLVSVIVCTATAVIAVKWGIADAQTNDAFKIIRGWSNSEEVRKPQWLQAQRKVSNAIAMEPLNAVHHEQLANLYFYSWSSLVEPDLDLEQAESARLTLAHSSKAIDLRPTWPAAYSLRSQIQWRIDPMNEQSRKDLIQFTKTGQFNYGQLGAMSQLGFIQTMFIDDEKLLEATLTLLINGLLVNDGEINKDSEALIDLLSASKIEAFRSQLTSRLDNQTWPSTALPKIKELRTRFSLPTH